MNFHSVMAQLSIAASGCSCESRQSKREYWLNGQRILICGYSRFDPVIKDSLFSEYAIRDCRFKHPITSFGATDEAKIIGDKNQIILIHYVRLPSLDTALNSRPVALYEDTIYADQAHYYTKSDVDHTFKINNDKNIAVVDKEYTRYNTLSGTEQRHGAQQMMGLLFEVALSKNTIASERLKYFKGDFQIISAVDQETLNRYLILLYKLSKPKSEHGIHD